MSEEGTQSYQGATDLPELVQRAVALADRLGFENSCNINQGRLLHVLARGQQGRTIGETGTGCGVGLAWMATAAGRDTTIVSIERDDERATEAARLFADWPNIIVRHGDWPELHGHAPFDLLVLDGGGSGKRNTEAIDPEAWVKPFGTLVVDDLTPIWTWPPVDPAGDVDDARLHWMEHPALLTTEVRLSANLSSLVMTRR